MKLKAAIGTFAITAMSNAFSFTLNDHLKDENSSFLKDEDIKAIESLMSIRNEAFQEKDADKLVSLFTNNSNFVNQSGRIYWGKDSNLERHKQVFSENAGPHLLARLPVKSELKKWCSYGNPATMVTIVTEYKFPNHSPDILITQYDPLKPTKGIFTTILFKTNNLEAIDGWQIVSMQNTPTLPIQHNE